MATKKLKWKRGRFKIHMNDGSWPLRSGLVAGVWGIRRVRGGHIRVNGSEYRAFGYVLTHLPTGYCASHPCSTLGWAKELAERLNQIGGAVSVRLDKRGNCAWKKCSLVAAKRVVEAFKQQT